VQSAKSVVNSSLPKNLFPKKQGARLSPSTQQFSDEPKLAPAKLFNFDLRASSFDLLFDVFGFLLGDPFLHRLGRALNQRLGLC
jgi:hypothetical protein